MSGSRSSSPSPQPADLDHEEEDEGNWWEGTSPLVYPLLEKDGSSGDAFSPLPSPASGFPRLLNEKGRSTGQQISFPAGDGNRFLSDDDDSDINIDALLGVLSNPFPKEENIKKFFGSDLVDSVKELGKIYKKAPNVRGVNELLSLINALKDFTIGEQIDEISTAARDLKETIPPLTEGQEVGRLIAKIIDAIALAVPGAIYGAKAGATIGAAAGGGVFSVPAATVGGIVGGIVGGVGGFWVNYCLFKPAKRISHYMSKDLAEADLVDTINEAVSRKMAKSK